MVRHHGVQQKHTLIYRRQHKLLSLTLEGVPLHLFQCVPCKHHKWLSKHVSNLKNDFELFTA